MQRQCDVGMMKNASETSFCGHNNKASDLTSGAARLKEDKQAQKYL